MSTVEVYIVAQELIGDMAIPDYAAGAMQRILTRGINQMEDYAKSNHRFSSRTGNLLSAIRSDIYNLSGRLYIDDFLCDYGKFVHNGQRSWAPDQFIYDAYDALSDDIASEMRDQLEMIELKRSADELAILAALLLSNNEEENATQSQNL